MTSWVGDGRDRCGQATSPLQTRIRCCTTRFRCASVPIRHRPVRSGHRSPDTRLTPSHGSRETTRRGSRHEKECFSLYTDKSLTCADCGQEFTFTAREQEFYADRGFSEPRRCVLPRQPQGSAQQRRRLWTVASATCGGYSSGGGGGYVGQAAATRRAAAAVTRPAAATRGRRRYSSRRARRRARCSRRPAPAAARPQVCRSGRPAASPSTAPTASPSVAPSLLPVLYIKAASHPNPRSTRPGASWCLGAGESASGAGHAARRRRGERSRPACPGGRRRRPRWRLRRSCPRGSRLHRRPPVAAYAARRR